jgi:predicted dehydrogenase
MRKDMAIKTAVIGYGHLGKWHVEKAIQLDSCELVAIVEHSDEALNEIREKYPDIEVTNDLTLILDKIDAAIIVTPTSTHYEVSKILLEAGKHIFCEKPLTSSLGEAEKILSLAQSSNKIVQVGHSERFHQIWDRKESYAPFIDNIGTVRIQRMAPFKGRATDVDVVQDLMIHDLDLVSHIFNEVPSQINAMGHKMRTDKWDYVTAHLEFPSGRDAFITVARNHIREVRDFEVTNKHGCFYIDLLNNEYYISWSHKDDVFKQSYPKRDHLLEEQKEFYQSIIEKKPAVVDIEDGVLAVKLVNLVLQSLEEERSIEIVGP